MGSAENNGFAAGLKSGKNGSQKVNVQTKGMVIMELADLLKPGLEQMLQGVKNADGLPVQPARIRGLALVLAQELVNASNATKH